MTTALVFALLAPLVWGVMNVLDKYVVSKKVRHPIGFAIVAMLMNLLFGALLALFLDWSAVSLRDVLFPAAAGVLLGLEFFFYYFLLRKDDVSHLIGFVYVYPLLIVLLSFFFLNEVLNLAGYLGVFLILSGAVMLSLRVQKLKLRVGAWMIGMMVVIVASYEFLIKVATTELPVLNGVAIDAIAIGLTSVPLLFYSKTFRAFLAEVRNAKWAVATELLTFSAVACTYFAMEGLPATFVASVGAAQPLAVVALENIVARHVGRFEHDHKLLPKLGAIVSIVAGVALLYLSGIA